MDNVSEIVEFAPLSYPANEVPAFLTVPPPGTDTETLAPAVFHDSPVVVSLVGCTTRPRLFHRPTAVAGTVPLAGVALVQALALSSVVVGTRMVMPNDLLVTPVS